MHPRGHELVHIRSIQRSLHFTHPVYDTMSPRGIFNNPSLPAFSYKTHTLLLSFNTTQCFSLLIQTIVLSHLSLSQRFSLRFHTPITFSMSMLQVLQASQRSLPVRTNASVFQNNFQSQLNCSIQKFAGHASWARGPILAIQTSRGRSFG